MPRLSAETSISSSVKTLSSWIDSRTLYGPTNRNTFRVHEILQRIFNQFGQVVGQCLVTDIVQIVIVWILSHPAIKVRPCQNVLR